MLFFGQGMDVVRAHHPEADTLRTPHEHVAGILQCQFCIWSVHAAGVDVRFVGTRLVEDLVAWPLIVLGAAHEAASDRRGPVDALMPIAPVVAVLAARLSGQFAGGSFSVGSQRLTHP